jgi:hypothetical protein
LVCAGHRIPVPGTVFSISRADTPGFYSKVIVPERSIA